MQLSSEEQENTWEIENKCFRENPQKSVIKDLIFSFMEKSFEVFLKSCSILHPNSFIFIFTQIVSDLLLPVTTNYIAGKNIP